jgi:hypothetical protein
VKRLVASLEIAARGNGYTDKERRAIVLATAARYRQAMQAFAAMRNLELWYAHLDMDTFVAQAGSLVDPKRLKAVERNLAKARTRDSLHAYEKLTSLVDGEPRIVSQPPLIVPIDELVPGMERDRFVTEIRGMLRDYRRTIETDRRHLLENFRFVDMARKVVGVGSVGTRAWIVLFRGRDGDDPLFLQVKGATRSVLEDYLGKSEYANHGQRVVAGQRLMQASSDIFLGWQRVTGFDGVQRDSLDRIGQVLAANNQPAIDELSRAAVESQRHLDDLKTEWRSRRTSGRGTCSTRRSPSSPPGTRTKTSATTRRSRRRWSPAGSRPRSASSIARRRPP